MDVSTDSFARQIPYYLTAEKQLGLMAELKNFENSSNGNYYLNKYEDEVLQGDAWSGFDAIDIVGGERRKIQGVILSNTCDISLENSRLVSPRVTFAPIMRLSKYSDVLLNAGHTETAVLNKLDAIRRQKVTEMIFLPKGGFLQAESVALLSDVQSIPFKIFEASAERQKLFTLSMFGFYMFLFKLSVHYCRFHENLDRS